MDVPVIDVDLALPPEERWRGLGPLVPAIVELTWMYLRDLGDIGPFRDALIGLRDGHVAEEHQREMRAIASMANLDPIEVLLANVYYDAFKHLVACTAFGVSTPDGPLHARNLDWMSQGNALSRHTIVVRYRRGEAELFESVTWPGFIGTLSGVAPGRFAVTLNAVLSDDAPGLGEPIALRLRELLTRASYDEAVADLRDAPLCCDCLLLVTGCYADEMVVIERTPSRFALRMPESPDVIVASNDYRALDIGKAAPTTDALTTTACARHDRALQRCLNDRPQDADACLAILSDPHVKMDITMQQMVMSPRHGLLTVRRGQ